MINPLNTGRRDAVTLRGIGGAGGTPSAGAAIAMGTLAGRVASTLSNALRLADGDAESGSGNASGDPYGVDEVARDLAEALGVGPAEEGGIARALHDFTRESAVLFTARPESVSLERVQAAINRAGTVSGVGAQQAIGVVDAATADIMRSVR